jgi:hypothetical protein
MPSVFNEQTTIRYYLPEAAYVNIRLYSLVGYESIEIVNHIQHENGEYLLTLNLNEFGLKPGMYILLFQAGEKTKTIKLLFTK